MVYEVQSCIYPGFPIMAGEFGWCFCLGSLVLGGDEVLWGNIAGALV